MSNYLKEAFKALDLLDSENDLILEGRSFSLDNTGIEDFMNYMNLDDIVVADIDVVDPQAETEEDLKATYVGDTILECVACHSLSYCNPTEVEIDEEAGVANMFIECPVCLSNEGYKIVGTVAPYEDIDVSTTGEAEDVKVEIDGSSATDVEVTETKVEEGKEATNSVDVGKTLRKSFGGRFTESCNNKTKGRRYHISRNEDEEALEVSQKHPVDVTKSEAGKLKESSEGEKAKAFFANKKRHLGTNGKEEAIEDSQKFPVEGTKQEDPKARYKKHLGTNKKGEDIEACQKHPVDVKKSEAGRLKEYYDDEAPLGRDRPYHNNGNQGDWSHLNNKAPQWWKDQGGTDASWASRISRKGRHNEETGRYEYYGESTKSQSKRWHLVEADGEEAEVTTDTQSEVTTDTKNNNTDAAFTALVDKLQAIDDYASFVAALKNLNADQKKLFMDNFGKIDHDKIKPQVNDTSIAVTELIPTQSEIDWKKSLDGIFEFGCAGAFASPAVAGSPVLVYNNKYIIDGHHRWSQIYTCNPNAKCSVTNYTYNSKDPDDVLRDFQGAVLASTGDVGEGKAGVNVWGASAEQMKKHVLDNIPDNVVAELGKYTNGAVKDKETAANYLIGNLAKLATNNQPYGGEAAPKRTDMPQTKDATKTLVKSQGLTKMSEAVVKKAKKRHISKNEDDEALEASQKNPVDVTKTKAGKLSESRKEQIKARLKKRHTGNNENEENLEDSQRYPVESPQAAQTGLKEAMEDISITTDGEVIKIKSTPRADKEMIVPPQEEPKKQEVEEETPAVSEEGETAEIEVEEIDDDAFSALGEAFLKKTYRNVDSFKTSSAKKADNALVLEGIITFKSGKKAKTRFMFEAATTTRKGNVRFVGLNEHIAKKKGSFKLDASIKDGKLVCESLNYNYTGKDARTGKSQRLYGTLRNK